MIRLSTETDLARDHAVPGGRPDRRLVAFRPDSPPGSPGGCPNRLLQVREAAHSRAVTSCCFPCFEKRLGRQIKSTDLKPEVPGHHDVQDRHPPRRPVPHLRREQHGAARPHRHPLAVQPHRRPGGALQDVVDHGMLPVVVGAGVGLDLGPVEAGRGVGHAREHPPSPAAGAAHRVERAEVDGQGGPVRTSDWPTGPSLTRPASPGMGTDGAGRPSFGDLLEQPVERPVVEASQPADGVGALQDPPPDGGRDLLRQQEQLVLAGAEDAGDRADQPLARGIGAVEPLVLDLAQVRGVLRRASRPDNFLASSAPAPAALRATTATLLLDAGVDIIKVKELLGHRHVTTTQVYDKRRRSAKEGASRDVPI